MLRTWRAGGNRRARQGAAGALLAGLLFWAGVCAADPTYGLTISPNGNDGKDVWGLNETISYTALCSPCTGTHNAQFTQAQGLTGGEGANAAWATVSGAKSATGTFTLAAKCPDDGSHGAPSRTFKVVDLPATGYFTVTGANLGTNGVYYVPKAASGDVTVTANLGETDLRAGFMVWTGGTAGASQLERKVTKIAAGTTTVTAKAGPNGSQRSVTIIVCSVAFAPWVTVDPNRLLWYCNGVSLYNTGGSLECTGVEEWLLHDFVWTVTSGADKVEVEPQAGGFMAWLSTTDASREPNDVTVTCAVNGVTVGTYTTTVYAPQHVGTRPGFTNPDDLTGGWDGTGPGGVPLTGWWTKYHLQVLDMFGAPLPGPLYLDEEFAGFTTDDSNWTDNALIGGNFTNSTACFHDDYRYSAWNPLFYPNVVHPGEPGWTSRKTCHWTQRYKAGIAAGSGRIVSSHTLQFYTGCARQE